jgi:trehalose 6-phosphate synthase
VDRPAVIVSNRGPVSFRVGDDGQLVPRRGAGGLVSGLGPVVAGTDTLWVAAAMSDGDRRAAASGLVDAEDFHVSLVAVDPDTYRLAYDVISNQVLWFLHHGLYDLPRDPAFGPDLDDAWAAYEEVNRAFADLVADTAPDGAAVLVQDYHLALLGPALAERRPDLDAVHFHHTPFATPTWLRVLPDRIAEPFMGALAAHRACGFHTARWAADFAASSQDVLGSAPPTFVSPLPAAADDIRGVAGSEACATALAELDEIAGDRAVVGRVDRIELSKNILRGFRAFDTLLERHPEHRERVVFLASVYPSRTGVPAYLAYQREVDAAVAEINERWATPGWTPIVYDTRDDFPRSVAVLRRADVLLVNPIRDGLNLVAKEGAIVNERDAVLCLSREAGVWDEIGEAALPVPPFDLAGTAAALDRGLTMPAAERAQRAARLRTLSSARTPADWLADQLAAAG